MAFISASSGFQRRFHRLAQVVGQPSLALEEHANLRVQISFLLGVRNPGQPRSGRIPRGKHDVKERKRN